MPSYDADFEKMVKMVLERYGWPRGTVIGVKFMNEPWEGMSISGWGANILRYREIFKALCEATEEAQKGIWDRSIDRRLRFLDLTPSTSSSATVRTTFSSTSTSAASITRA